MNEKIDSSKKKSVSIVHELFIEQIMITLYGQTFRVSKMYDIFILAMHQ